jgi:hypothetical protein
MPKRIERKRKRRRRRGRRWWRKNEGDSPKVQTAIFYTQS